MDESDAQQGLAHLLEHMAFNGSTHVPNGEMIKILERHGLAFGADTNASTSWDETVYKLDLPKADDDTVDTSLMLLREVAGELTLDQGAIDKERGVVLSEERLRDTPGYRVSKASLGFDLEGQLAAEPLSRSARSRRSETPPATRCSTSTRATIGPNARCWSPSATSIPTPWRPRSRPASATGRPRRPAGPDPDLGAPLATRGR